MVDYARPAAQPEGVSGPVDAGESPYRAPGPAALAHALGFTAQDLAANRRGQLTERQAARLRREAALQVARAVAVWAPAFLVLALLFNTSGVEGVLLALTLTGVPIGIVAVRLWPLVSDANAMCVSEAQGVAAPERWQPAFWARTAWLFRRRPGYYLRLGADRFRVPRAAYLAVEAGPCAVYFTPRARAVVSAEALDADQAV